MAVYEHKLLPIALYDDDEEVKSGSISSLMLRIEVSFKILHEIFAE